MKISYQWADINGLTRKCSEKKLFDASPHFPNLEPILSERVLRLMRKPTADPNSKPTYFLDHLGCQLHPHWHLYSTPALLSLSSELPYVFDDFSLPGSFWPVSGPPTPRGSAPGLVEVLAVTILSIDLLESLPSSSFFWNSPSLTLIFSILPPSSHPLAEEMS